jgi:hypothetical protein
VWNVVVGVLYIFLGDLWWCVGVAPGLFGCLRLGG